MPRTISSRDNFVKPKVSGWDKTISDAQTHIVRLKAAIRHAREMKERREPWPGMQSSNQKSESATQC